MSTTTCNVRGKQSDGLLQKVGPMKATIPMSLLRPLNSAGSIGGPTATNSNRLFCTLSPPMRLISPDHNSSGHRSPGANNYYKGTHLRFLATFSQAKIFVSFHWCAFLFVVSWNLSCGFFQWNLFFFLRPSWLIVEASEFDAFLRAPMIKAISSPSIRFYFKHFNCMAFLRTLRRFSSPRCALFICKLKTFPLNTY